MGSVHAAVAAQGHNDERLRKHLTNLCNFRLGIKSFRNSVINIHVKEIR